MENSPYDKIVDIIIDNLYTSFVDALDNNYKPDFSVFRSQFLSIVQSNQSENIEGIIGSCFVQEMQKYNRKIQGVISNAKGKESRDYIERRHHKVWNKLIENGKACSKRCAQYIIDARATILTENNEKPSFRESLKVPNVSPVNPLSSISHEEALLRAAQTVYNKTNNIPEGYVLNGNGQIEKDSSIESPKTPSVSEIDSNVR